jgi:hypothetical protein
VERAAPCVEGDHSADGQKSGRLEVPEEVAASSGHFGIRMGGPLAQDGLGRPGEVTKLGLRAASDVGVRIPEGFQEREGDPSAAGRHGGRLGHRTARQEHQPQPHAPHD